MPGLLNRHIIGPCLARSQVQLNAYYSGSFWMLAERYTSVGKILFISLLYSFITPMALLIASVAFFAVFCVDNYMLLRR